MMITTIYNHLQPITIQLQPITIQLRPITMNYNDI